VWTLSSLCFDAWLGLIGHPSSVVFALLRRDHHHHPSADICRRPFTGNEIDRLVGQAAVPSLAPYYVDIFPCQPTLHSMVDRMKSVSGSVMVATCKASRYFLLVN